MKLNITFKFSWIVVLVGLSVLANGQGFSWAQAFTATGVSSAAAGVCRTTFDANNNVYSLIGFKGTVDFDKSANVHNLTSTGNTDMVLLKEDATGNFQWAKHFQCKSTNSFGVYVNQTRIAVDEAGYIYLTGHFIDTVDFDPGTGVFYMGTPPNYSNIFIVKLDSVGSFIWAKQIGGGATSTANLRDMKMNNQGIRLLFTAWNNVDVAPDTSVVNMSGGILELLDTGGHYVWAKNDYLGTAFALDSFSNFYITGGFKGTVDFDPGIGVFNLTATPTTSWLSSNDSIDVFIQKLDSAGNFLWVKQVGGSLWDMPGDIAVDRWGNIAVTGHFSGTADFDPSSGVYNLTSNSTRSIFTLKLRNNGDFVWAQKAGDFVGLYEGRGIATDTTGNVYVVSYGYPAQKFDSSGNLLWTLATAGTTGWIVLDNDNSIYLSGSFSGTQDFDPGLGVYNLTGNNSGFILKLCQNTPAAIPLTASADTVCAGDTVWLTTPVVPGATRYYWQRQNTYFTDTNTIAVTASGSYRVTVYGGSCPLESNWVVVYIAPKGNTSLTLSAPPSAPPGQGVTVNASLTDPGSNYAIDWYRNGILLATNNAPLYSFAKTVVDDTVYAILHPQTLCYDTAVTSDTVIILTDVTDTTAAATHLQSINISVYPNPFGNILTVSGLSRDDRLLLLDATGRVVLRKEAVQSVENMDTKELAAGYYIIKLFSKEGNVKGNVPVVKK